MKNRPLLIFIFWLFIFVVGIYLQGLPVFKEFRQKVQTQAVPSIQKARANNLLEPTASAARLIPYLSDLKIDEQESVDLRPFIPELAAQSAEMLIDSSLQIKIGKSLGKYILELFWNADAENAELRIVLVDDYLRPMGVFKSANGKLQANIEAAGGVYKLRLSSRGKFGKDYQLHIRSTPILKGQPSKNEALIPVLELSLSSSAERRWRQLLRVGRARLKGKSGAPADYLPNRSLRGALIYKNDRSAVEISLSGVGDIRHFSEEHPSFTANIVAGPLVYGMSKFKLVNIKNTEGVLNYVVSSIIRDEGLFVAPSRITRLFLNGRYLGIYVMEERYCPELFAKLNRYDGEIHAFTHHLPVAYYKPPLPNIYFRPKKATSELPEIPDFYADVFAEGADKIKFAKALGLFCRFHSTHGINHADLRFYRDPILGIFEPVIRDIDVDMWRENPAHVDNYWTGTISSFLQQTHWWFGKRPSGIGTIYNAKVYPNPNLFFPMSAYYATPVSLGLSDLSPGVTQFINIAENRQLFEQFLFYFSGGTFRRRFLKRLSSTFEATKAYLDEQDYNRLKMQLEHYQKDDFKVARSLPALTEHSYLLVIEENDLFVLYNLSCFSMRVELPEYVSVEFPRQAYAGRVELNNFYLAPSVLSPMIDAGCLNKTSGLRLLQLEMWRYLSETSAVTSESGSPIVKVSVPKEKKAEFIEFIKHQSHKVLAGTFPISQDNVIYNWAFPGSAAFDKKSELYFPSRQFAQKRYKMAEELMGNKPSKLIVLPIDVIPTEQGYALHFLFINNSLENLELDLTKLGISFGFPQDKFICSVDDCYSLGKQKESHLYAWRIFDAFVQPEKGKLSLGACAKIEQDRSAFIWTDALRAFLLGPREASKPNLALVRIEVPTDNQLLYYITNPKMIYNAVSGSRNLQVIVHEYCLNVLHPHGYHKDWRREKENFKQASIDCPFLKVVRDPDRDVPIVQFTSKDMVLPSLVVIPEGYILEIEPGTTLRFKENGAILSFSPVRACGTKEEPIIFAPAESVLSWPGLAIVKAGGESLLSNINVSQVRGGKIGPYYSSGGISVLESSVEMKHIRIDNALAVDAVHLYKTDFSISDLQINQAKGDGIDVDWGWGHIFNSDFNSTGGDALDFSGSLVEVKQCEFNGAGDKGISIGEASSVSVFSSHFAGNKIGIAVKDQSQASLIECTFTDNRFGVAAYIKKPAYAYPALNIAGCRYSNNNKNIVYEPADSCTRNFN